MDVVGARQQSHVVEKSRFVYEVARDGRPATMWQQRSPRHHLHQVKSMVASLQRRLERQTWRLYDVMGNEAMNEGTLEGCT